MKHVALGVEIDGAAASFGLIGNNGTCHLEGSIHTKPDEDAESLFFRLFSKVNKVLADTEEQFEISGVGIGAPCANYSSGTIENSSNLNWSYVNVVEIVKKYYSLPVAITNDANAAALGEMRFGNARHMKNFIQLILSHGLGCGIVAEGNILSGKDGFAGEIGHTIVEKSGRLCGCGRRGCLETYASSTGIVRTYYELLSVMNEDSMLKEYTPSEMTAALVFKAAQCGDKTALAVFEHTGRILGEALANTVALFSPEAIIFSGVPALTSDLLLKPAGEYMEKNLLYMYKGKVKILPSALTNGNVTILGASALIWNDIQKAGKKSLQI